MKQASGTDTTKQSKNVRNGVVFITYIRNRSTVHPLPLDLFHPYMAMRAVQPTSFWQLSLGLLLVAASLPTMEAFSFVHVGRNIISAQLLTKTRRGRRSFYPSSPHSTLKNDHSILYSNMTGDHPSPSSTSSASKIENITSQTANITTVKGDDQRTSSEVHHHLSVTSSPSSSASPPNQLMFANQKPPPPAEPLPRRPLVRLIDNIWFIVCTPFPDLRKLSRKRENDSKFVASIRLRDGFAAVFAYLALGVISYRYIFEKQWSFIDSLYFTCCTFATIGYGDIVAKTVAGKFFSCLFGISGIALLGAAVARIGSRLVEAEIEAVKQTRQKSQRRILQVYDKMPKAVMKVRRSSHKTQKKLLQEARELLASIPHPPFPPFLATFWKAARYIIQSLSIVALGGLVIGYLEGWKWYDSIYYGLITASTIGLGDFAPQTQAGRLAAVVFIPMSVAAAGEILASVGLAMVERRQKNLFRTQLNKGLTMETLNSMDANHDGKVVREEYVSYMLMEMGLVTKEELEELWDQFERLDATKSGHLNHDDLVLMAKLRGAGLVES